MYRITYHHQVADDIATVTKSARSAIKAAIEGKLTTEPALFGKPLQFSLKGLRSMRVQDYRVVFRLTHNEVYIVLIAHRSVVYRQASKRNGD